MLLALYIGAFIANKTKSLHNCTTASKATTSLRVDFTLSKHMHTLYLIKRKKLKGSARERD